MRALITGVSGFVGPYREDPDRMRPSDVPILLGSYAKFRKETGWSPHIDFTQTLQESLEYWRFVLKN